MAKKPGAHQSRAHHERAQSAYDEILSQEGEPAADLKSLIAGIKAATARKAQTQKRISRKQVQQAKDKLTKEQRTLNLKEQALDEEYRREKVRLQVEEQRAQELKTNVALAVAQDPKRDQHYDLGVEFTQIYTQLTEVLDVKEAQLPLAMAQDLVVLERMWRDLNELAQRINQLSIVLFSEDVVKAEAEKFKLLLQRVQPRLRRIQEAVAGNKRLRSNAPLALPDKSPSSYKPKGAFADVTDANLVKTGSRNQLMRLMGMFGRGVTGAVAGAGNAMIGGGKIVSSRMTSMALKSQAVVAKAGAAIHRLGTKIGEVKDSGVEWMKKVGDLFGYVRRKWSSLKTGASSGAGMLGQLLGLGMLFDSLIKPIFQELNSELEKRFGPNYVRDFMSSMWDKAKTWMMDGIKNFLGLDKERQKAEPAVEAANAALDKAEAEAKKKGTTTAGHLDYGTMAGQFWTGLKNGFGSEEYLGKLVDEYQNPATTIQRRTLDAEAISAFLRDAKIKGTPLSTKMISRLQTAGFDMRGVMKTTQSPATSSPSLRTSSNSFSNPAGDFVMDMDPIETSQPVTAPIPPRAASTATAPKPATKAPTAPGVGNHQVSNHIGSDLFEAINGKLLTGF